MSNCSTLKYVSQQPAVKPHMKLAVRRPKLNDFHRWLLMRLGYRRLFIPNDLTPISVDTRIGFCRIIMMLCELIL